MVELDVGVHPDCERSCRPPPSSSEAEEHSADLLEEHPLAPSSSSPPSSTQHLPTMLHENLRLYVLSTAEIPRKQQANTCIQCQLRLE